MYKLHIPSTLLAGWMLATGFASAAAQQGPLDSLVDEGLRANLGLAQVRYRDSQSVARVQAARGLFLPSVDLDARYSRVSGGLDFGDLVNPAYVALNQLTGTSQYPTDLSLVLPFQQDMRLRAAVPLFNPTVIANYSLARNQRGLSQSQVGGAARALAATIQLAWLRHATAVRSVALYRSTLDIIEENLRVSERLVAAGTATPDNVSRARADLAEMEQRVADATRLRDAAARAFNQLLQRPLDTPVAMIPDSALMRPIDVPLGAALESAVERRDELKEAAWGVKVAQAQTKLATASFLPAISLAGDVGYQGNKVRFTGENDFAVASLVLQWNLFRGGADAARRAEGQFATASARAAERDAASAVELDVRQAYEAARVAEQEIGVAGQRLVAARRTFDLVQRRYDEGLAPHIEFTQARSDYTNAGINEIITRYAYLARLVELERAAALRDISY